MIRTEGGLLAPADAVAPTIIVKDDVRKLWRLQEALAPLSLGVAVVCGKCDTPVGFAPTEAGQVEGECACRRIRLEQRR